ncbi:hypothetical protein Leryth_027036 [Lithospermum erythrorhizon]|nr:hypothetical protein Leryth_027036 [Lithospermum erythrorhizon]
MIVPMKSLMILYSSPQTMFRPNRQQGIDFSTTSENSEVAVSSIVQLVPLQEGVTTNDSGLEALNEATRLMDLILVMFRLEFWTKNTCRPTHSTSILTLASKNKSTHQRDDPLSSSPVRNIFHENKFPGSGNGSIQNVESSVQSLIKTWNKRQKWECFFNLRIQVDETASWRDQLTNMLESNLIRIATICLLLVDLVLTSIELTLSLVSCNTESNNNDKRAEEKWFHWVAISILCVLSAKIFALGIGLGRSFFMRPGYVVDGVVVVVALILEVYLVKGCGGLVVVVSLWRIVRVVEAAFEISDETIEAKIANTVSQFEGLKDENMRLQEMIVEKDSVIEQLWKEIEVSED